MYKIYVNDTLFCSSKIEELAILNPVIDLEVNTAGTFTFTIPPKHPYYDLIERKTSLIDVYRDDETEPLFEGICASVDVDFYKQKKITCEGELTFLNDSTLRPAYRQGLTSRQLLEAYINEHNSLVESMKQFTVGQVTAADSNDYITCYTNYNSTMTEIKEDLIDDIGGYIRCRHEGGVRYIDYLADSPRTNSQVIKLGENLLDLTTNLNTDDLATVIIPLGETLETQTVSGLDDKLNIKTAAADSMHPSGTDYVYSSDAVSNFGWIEKVVEWDNVTTVEALLAKGKKYLQETQFENLTIEAQAIDLGLTSSEFQKFKLLDSIRVVSAPHGLDRYFMLSKMTINLNNPENDTITLGVEESHSLTAKSASTNSDILNRIEQLPTSNILKSAIDNATALITGSEGGYVVIETNADGQPIELKIQDALNNPTKIWRWNINGLGYSSDGGSTYGLAMTMNGAIVADYITTGTMYADRIKGGTLTLGGASNASGLLQVKDASNNLVGEWGYGGIRLYKGTVGGWYIGDGYIMSYNGTTEATSTYKVCLFKYYNNPANWAFAVYTRASTSDSWVGKFAVTYEGNIISQDAINFYPTNSSYGTHIHGALSVDGKLHMEGGIIEGVGYITASNNIYTGGNLSGNVTDGRSGLNCTGGGLYVAGNGYIAGSLGCGGTKPRIVHTETYGYRAMNAYETPTPYFGDIGEGMTNENGECIIFIDEIFAECVNLDVNYQVFLEKYGQGDIWVEERNPNNFVVKGSPSLKFGWEIKAVQLYYEDVRLDTPEDKMLATIIEQQAQEGI